MVWVESKTFWFFLPTLDDVLIGRETVEGFEPFGEIISIHEVIAVLFDLLVVFIVIPFNGCLLQSSVHTLHLTVGPRVARAYEAMLNTILFTGVTALEGCPSF
jgi:hypothetical protein